MYFTTLKIKNIYSSKDTVNIVKILAIEWENTFAIYN